MSTRRRRALVAIPVLALAVVIACCVIANIGVTSVVAVHSFGMLDERTLVLPVISGRDATCRLAEKAESTTEVRVSVTCHRVPLGSETALGYPYEVTVTLESALGSRTLIDASSGASADYARCHSFEGKICVPWPWSPDGTSSTSSPIPATGASSGPG